MNLSQYKNEEAIDVLAELLEPAAEIIADKETRQMLAANKPRLLIVKTAMKNQPKAIIQFMAALHRKKPEEYEFTIPELFTDLIDVLNDPAVMGLFQSPQSTVTSSGSATESTEVEKM